MLKRPFAQHVQAVAPDGSIVYLEGQPATGSDLWTLTPDGRTSPLVVTPFNESSSSISADGRFMAYVSDESGRNDVYAIPTSGKGDRVPISIDGGTGPVWSRDRRELFYRAGDDLISVQVRTTGALVLGERRKLLDLFRYDSVTLTNSMSRPMDSGFCSSERSRSPARRASTSSSTGSTS